MKKSINNNLIIELHVPDLNVVKDFRMVDPFGFYLRFTELIDWGQR